MAIRARFRRTRMRSVNVGSHAALQMRLKICNNPQFMIFQVMNCLPNARVPPPHLDTAKSPTGSLRHPKSHSKAVEKAITHPLINIIRTELHRRIRHNSYAIRSIPRHETPPPLFPPHLAQRLVHRHFIFFPPDALYLEQNLKALERGHDGSRDSARHAAGYEGCEDGLCKGLPYALEGCEVGCEGLLSIVSRAVHYSHSAGVSKRVHTLASWSTGELMIAPFRDCDVVPGLLT